MMETASKGIGTGLGIAAMGIGMGIAFDAMRGLDRQMQRQPSRLQPIQMKKIRLEPIRFKL